MTKFELENLAQKLEFISKRIETVRNTARLPTYQQSELAEISWDLQATSEQLKKAVA